jgi:hypothetical protein
VSSAPRWLREPRCATSSNWCRARASQGRDAACHQLVTGSHACTPSEPRYALPVGWDPTGRSECAVASRTHPSLPHVTSHLVSSAPQVALPGGTDDGCRALLGLPRGYCIGRPAHVCAPWASGHGHIIYLFTHLLSSLLEGAHAAEVRGDSAAITLYWSEGVRSNIPTISL